MVWERVVGSTGQGGNICYDIALQLTGKGRIMVMMVGLEHGRIKIHTDLLYCTTGVGGPIYPLLLTYNKFHFFEGIIQLSVGIQYCNI